MSPAEPPLYVTRPELPALADLMPALESIWASRQLTNGGAFHQRLELELAGFLGVQAVALFANGTLALMAAMRALELSGEVITTPFSFVATSHALLWNGLTPVFADIGADSFTLDPQRVEAAITPQTSAILAVHVYGHPCDTAALQDIAQRHGLKLLYDAAHAFGVQAQGGNLLQAGDLSVLSFHATKVFNTFEGGAVVCADLQTKGRLERLKNFGFVNEVSVESLGINAKMNELQAAIGCLQLPGFAAANERRGAIDRFYRSALAGVAGLGLPAPPAVAMHNYGYFPVLVRPDFAVSRDELYRRMRAEGVMVRRYFYPLISEFPMYRDAPSAQADGLPNAVRAARQVLCLPLYAGLQAADCERVVKALLACAG